jgi:hypothetical protein
VVSILFHISTSEAEVDKRKKERDGEREIGHVRYMRKNPLLPPGSKTHPSKNHFYHSAGNNAALRIYSLSFYLSVFK